MERPDPLRMAAMMQGDPRATVAFAMLVFAGSAEVLAPQRRWPHRLTEASVMDRGASERLPATVLGRRRTFEQRMARVARRRGDGRPGLATRPTGCAGRESRRHRRLAPHRYPRPEHLRGADGRKWPALRQHAGDRPDGLDARARVAKLVSQCGGQDNCRQPFGSTSRFERQRTTLRVRS
jgi:hypothetical protein